MVTVVVVVVREDKQLSVLLLPLPSAGCGAVPVAAMERASGLPVERDESRVPGSVTTRGLRVVIDK